MKRALVPVFVAALATAAAIGCHSDKNTDNTAGTTDTIQTGAATAGAVASNSSGGASPAMSTTAPVPGTSSAATSDTASTHPVTAPTPSQTRT